MNKQKAQAVFACLVILLSLVTVIGVAQTPPGANTLQHGEGGNMPTLTAQYGYFYGDPPVNITDQLFGDFGALPVSTTSDVTAGGYFLDTDNKTDIFAYPQTETSYTIWVDGATYYSKNGGTGVVTSGANAATLINNIEASLTTGGLIQFKNGTFEGQFTVTNDNVVVRGNGKSTILKLPNGINANAALFTVTGSSFVCEDALLYGNEENQISGDQFAFIFDGSKNGYVDAWIDRFRTTEARRINGGEAAVNNKYYQPSEYNKMVLFSGSVSDFTRMNQMGTFNQFVRDTTEYYIGDASARASVVPTTASGSGTVAGIYTIENGPIDLRRYDLSIIIKLDVANYNDLQAKIRRTSNYGYIRLYIDGTIATTYYLDRVPTEEWQEIFLKQSGSGLSDMDKLISISRIEIRLYGFPYLTYPVTYYLDSIIATPRTGPSIITPAADDATLTQTLAIDAVHNASFNFVHAISLVNNLSNPLQIPINNYLLYRKMGDEISAHGVTHNAHDYNIYYESLKAKLQLESLGLGPIRFYSETGGTSLWQSIYMEEVLSMIYDGARAAHSANPMVMNEIGEYKIHMGLDQMESGYYPFGSAQIKIYAGYVSKYHLWRTLFIHSIAANPYPTIAEYQGFIEYCLSYGIDLRTYSEVIYGQKVSQLPSGGQPPQTITQKIGPCLASDVDYVLASTILTANRQTVTVGITNPDVYRGLSVSSDRPASAPTRAHFVGTGLNDMTTSGVFTGATQTWYVVQIDSTGAPDTFKWSNDAGLTWEATLVPITGGAQLLEEGISITFAATNGHTVNAAWDFEALAVVILQGVNWENIPIVEYVYLTDDVNPILTDKAFKTVTEITLPSLPNGGAGDTVSVGISDKIGLYGCLSPGPEHWAPVGQVIQQARKAAAATSYTIEAVGTIDEFYMTVDISATGVIVADDWFEITYIALVDTR